MLFEEEAQIVAQRIIYRTPSSIFVSRYLVKKESGAMWFMPVKLCVFHMELLIFFVIVKKELWTLAVIKFFQNGTFEKITITATEVVLIQLFCWF